MMTETLLATLLLGGPLTVAGSPQGPPDPALPVDTVQEPTPLTLTDVLTSALRTHPTVGAAEARLDAATAARGEARATLLPTLAATALARQHQEPMVVAPLHGFDIRSPPRFDETLYQGHASARYTLFDGGARSARIGAAVAVKESAASGLMAAQDRVLAEATSAFLATLTARDVLGAHEGWVEALERELDRTRLLFEEGKTPRLAVLRAEAALSRARAEREAADEGLQLARRRLARISGMDPDRVRGAVLAPVTLRGEPLPDRDALGALAREANPTLGQAASRVAAAETRVEAARSSYFPRIALSGAYSAFAAPSTDVTGEWQAGVEVSYPLFTGGARRAGVARAEAEVTAARAERQLAEQQVDDAVDAALMAYRAARARVSALEAAVEQSEEVARIEALALESGAGVQTDYLRAEAELVEARSGLAEARHAQVDARVRLALATGTLSRGWLVQMTEGAER